MKILLGVVGGAVLLIVAVVVWLYYATAKKGERVYLDILQKISPVAEALRAGKTPDSADVLRFAEMRETRKVLYETLLEFKRLDLFPRAHLTWEAMAEADLVLWLCHPNELGSPPDEIELMAKVPTPSATAPPNSRYFVFRFRVKPPHWAANDGWMAGVAGPYPTAGEPAPDARGTFSRFEAYDSRSPEEHVKVIHKRASPLNPLRP